MNAREIMGGLTLTQRGTLLAFSDQWQATVATPLADLMNLLLMSPKLADVEPRSNRVRLSPLGLEVRELLTKGTPDV